MCPITQRNIIIQELQMTISIITSGMIIIIIIIIIIIMMIITIMTLRPMFTYPTTFLYRNTERQKNENIKKL